MSLVQWGEGCCVFGTFNQCTVQAHMPKVAVH